MLYLKTGFIMYYWLKTFITQAYIEPINMERVLEKPVIAELVG